MICPKCQSTACTKAGRGTYRGGKVQMIRCDTCGYRGKQDVFEVKDGS